MHPHPHIAISLATQMIALVLSTAPCLAQPADSQPADPDTAKAAPTITRELRGQLGATINNAGLQQRFDLSWRRKLSASRNPLLSEAHATIGASSAITPSHVRGGVWAEIAPLSFFVVRAGAEPAYYFGTFDSLTSFASRHDAFDPDSRKEHGGAAAGTVTRLYVTPTLQFRAGRFVGATSADVEWWSSNASGPYFYEATRDTLLDVNGDRLMALTSAVLYEHPLAAGGHLAAGLTHALTRVNDESLNQIQHVGMVVIRQFDRRFIGLTRPSFTTAVWRYLDDPSKRDQWGGALAVGFSLSRK
jgi:hypothetical protein